MDRPRDPDAEALRRRLYRSGADEDDVRRYLAAAPTTTEEPAAAPPAPPRRRRSGLLLLIAAVAAAAAAALVVPVLRQSTPTPAPSTTPSVVVLPTDEPDVVFADAGTVLIYRGTGSRTVALETALAPRTGSMTIAADAGGSGPLSWSAVRSATDPAEEPDRIRLRPDGDEATPVRLDYTGAPPDRIAVEAGPQARWTLIVTFLRGRTPA